MRTEQVEDRSHAELAAQFRDMGHAAMELRGEAEREADAVEALLGPFGAGLDGHAQFAEHVGAAGLARNRPVAVLDHRHAGRAATTSAAAVLMLKVPLSSPPVPQVSRTGPETGTRRTICSRSTWAAAAISSAVSPFMRRAVRNAAPRASSTRPATRSRTASVTRPEGRSRRLKSKG